MAWIKRWLQPRLRHRSFSAKWLFSLFLGNLPATLSSRRMHAPRVIFGMICFSSATKQELYTRRPEQKMECVSENCLCGNSDNSIADGPRTGSFCEKYLSLGEGSDHAHPSSILPLQLPVLTYSIERSHRFRRSCDKGVICGSSICFIPSSGKLREENDFP